MALSNRERQRRYREKLKRQGFIKIAIWVPEGASADMILLGEKLCKSLDYTPGPIRNVRTGKLVSLNHA